MSNDSSPEPVGSMNLAMALALATKGYRVFPCKPGSKEPATKHGVLDASNDADDIRRWFGNDRGFNLGLAMGPLPHIGSHIVAIDVDRKSGGLETWAGLEARYTVPPAPRHETPNGGFHLFFETGAVDLRNSRNKLGQGIDTRCDGGYVVVPRSRLIDFSTGEIIGYYSTTRTTSLVTLDPPPMPDWMLALLQAGPEPTVRDQPICHGDEDTPADALRKRWDWDVELARDGWTPGRSVGDGRYWTRPGKNPRDGHSAVVHDSGAFVIFTTEAPPGLEQIGRITKDGTGFTVSPFQYLAWRDHGGDMKAAAAAVRREMPGPLKVGPDTPVEDPTDLTGAPTVPDEWWQQRPILAHIHQAAKATMVSPEALLLHALCRASALIPPCYKLPGITGGTAGAGTLDLMGCVVGETGAGKTLSAKIARDLVLDPAAEVPWAERAVLLDVPVGSGEGLIEAFYENVMEENEDGKKAPVRRIVHKGVFMVCDEGNAFISVQSRKGVTIVETMNSAWSGETLGQANANTERFRLIPAGTVRFAAVLNMQASNAHKLFDESLTVVGFPGRLLFAPAADPEATLDGPEWPGPIELPRWPSFGNHQFLTYDPAITQEIKERILAQVRGDHDQKRSQNIVGQCKVAGVLTMIDERTHVSISDWVLASHIMERSSTFLATLEAKRAQFLRDDSHRRSELRGEMEAVAESAKERAQMGRTADRILSLLSEGPMAGAAISKRLSTQARPMRDDALEHLRQLGKITLDGDHWKKV